MRAGLHDEARRSERGRDVGRPSERSLFARDRRDLDRAVDAVLNGQHGRVTAEHRRQERQRRRVVVGLDRHDDRVHRADARRILLGRRPTRKSPRELWTCRPRSRIAARCAPRAMKVTSCPACASRAP